jgi:hypothetical protein
LQSTNDKQSKREKIGTLSNSQTYLKTSVKFTLTINKTKAMIYTEITESQFIWDETIRGSFSYNGAKELYNYLTDFSSEQEPVQFDPIALRCDFSEYSSLAELTGDYPEISSLEQLEEETIVLTFEGGIIIQKF